MTSQFKLIANKKQRTIGLLTSSTEEESPDIDDLKNRIGRKNENHNDENFRKIAYR